MFFAYKKDWKYNIIVFDNYDYGKKNSVLLWIYINKINAFQKIYAFALKKNITKASFARIVLVLTLQIPLKIINLCYEILYNDGANLNEKLLFIYDSKHETVKELKIEFLNHKVYLNCFNIYAFVKNLKASGVPPEKCHELIKLLKHHLNGFYGFESREKARLRFYMCNIKTKEGVAIPFTHPAHVWNTVIKSYKYEDNNKLVLHSTSNKEIKITATQVKLDPINELIKKNSKDPGTILSYDVKCEPISEFKAVRKVNVESVLHSGKNTIKKDLGIELHLDYEDYLNEKERVINSIFSLYSAKDKTVNPAFVSQIKNNLWTDSLNTIDDTTLLQLISNDD